jgi:hypothetical protein
LALAGCARSADVVPLNDAANTAGIPKIDLKLYCTGYSPVTVTMPDGEVLTGHYELTLGGAVATGFGTAVSPGRTAVATGSSAVPRPRDRSICKR